MTPDLKDEQRMLLLQRQMKDAEESLTDPAMFDLPHPARIAAVPASRPDFMLMSICERRHEPLLTNMLSQGAGTLAVFDALDKTNDSRFPGFMHMSSDQAEGAFGNGAAGATIQSIRYVLGKGVVYQFNSSLLAKLQKTLISAEMPTTALKLPSKEIYIELGADRGLSPGYLEHPHSGLHAAEGAYVSSVKGIDGEDLLEITITGSPMGRENILDDAIEWFSLKVAPDISIVEAVKTSFAPAVERDYTSPEVAAYRAARITPLIELIAKCILFLGVDGAQLQEVKEGELARRKVMQAVSGAHKRKARKAAARSYDRFLVTARSTAEGDVGRTVGTHWRDGHFRHQRHGAGLSLVKVIWIEPVLVNASHMAA